LEQRVWNGLDNNVGLYPEPQVRAVINEGLKKLNIVCGIAQDTIPVPGFSVAGQQEYVTPTGIVIPIKVYFEGRILDPFSLRELATRFRKWATDTTANYGPVNRWVTVGLGTFIIHPIDAVGGNLIEVQGIVPITPLTAPGQTVSVEDQMCDLLVDYCCSRIMLKEQGKPFANASMAYQDMITKMKALTIWKGGISFSPYYLLKELTPTLVQETN
jgi:hypothetical protein